MATIITGKAAMPVPGSSRAPRTFDGKEEDIAESLEQFENCADDTQIPESARVPFLFRYLSRQQKDVFKTFEGYSPSIWATFKASIEEAFEGAFKEKKYTRQSLIQFTRSRGSFRISTDAELRAYHREFQAIAHYLISAGSISEEERDRFFSFGMHEDSRRSIEQWLTITHPDHPRTKPYKYADVFKAGKYIFDVNAFHNSPPEGLDNPSQLLYKSQGSASESHVVTRTVGFPTTPRSSLASEDLDSLVQRLRNLQVNAPEYANIYARLVSFIPRPANNTFQANPRTPCLFCKDPANIHLTRNCPVAQEYLKNNKVSFVDGFWRWPNGARIRADPQGFKHVIDSAQLPPSTTLFFEVLPSTQSTATAARFIEEVHENTSVQDAYKAYQLALAASKDKKSSVPAPISTPTPVSGSASTPSLSSDKKIPQFHYKLKVEDAAIAQKVFNRMMESPVMLSQGELLALAPDIRKLFVDGCKVNRIPVYSVSALTVERPTSGTVFLAKGAPSYTSAIMELDVKILGKHRRLDSMTVDQSLCVSAKSQQRK